MLPVTQRPNRRTQTPALALLVACVLASLSASVLGLGTFQVRLIEQDNSRLISTSNYNYAIASPKLLAKGWQTVSVNGDQVQVTLASDGQQQVLSRSQLAPADMSFVEQLRNEIFSSNNGYFHTSTTGGYASSSSSSSSSWSGASGNNVIISSSNSAGPSSSTSFQSTSGGSDYNMRDEDNFSVSRSDFPYDWSRVFFNGNTLTFVTRSGEVRMQPMSSLAPDQLAAVNKIKAQVLEMRQTQTQQAAHTMQHSMDMVSNMFGNIMGQFPQPPNYQSAVGGMFGNNWPFGSNNNPFSAPGWPFNGGRRRRRWA